MVAFFVGLFAVIGFLDLVGRFATGLHDWSFARRLFAFFGIYHEKTVQRNAQELCHSVVQRTYQELGFSRTLNQLRAKNSWWEYGAVSDDHERCHRLMHLLCEHIEKYNDELKYGHNKKSHYYINTMEAALEEEKRRLMCHLLSALMHSKEFEAPDFIVVPKDGNALLAAEWTNIHKYSLGLLARGEKDLARAIFDGQSFASAGGAVLANGVAENIEGLKRLLARAERCQKPLRGALIDCNASGGTQIISIMEEFNKNINECGRIEPITKAFVLFRIDTHDDIDGKFEDRGYSIHRWFELSSGDAIKKKMWEAKISWKSRASKAQIDKSIRDLLAQVGPGK